MLVRICDGSLTERGRSRGVRGLGLFIGASLLVVTAIFNADPALAQEISFKPLPLEIPPQRRLSADPDRPNDAPSSQLIELTGIQDDPDTALRVAIKAHNASVVAYGLNDPRRIIPTINLGVARLRAGGTLDAMRDFRSAIDMASSAESPRDPRLGEAYYGLGSAHFALGQWPAAIKAFEDGLQQQRVHSGLYSEGQIDFLRALALSNRELGRVKVADRWQERRIAVAERVFQSDAARMAWTYVSAGRWFRDGGRIEDAIALHGRAVSVIEAAYGPDAPLLIGPLLDLAISGALRGSAPGLAPLFPKLTPEATLDRARRLALADQSTPASDRAQVLERVGDVHWLLGRHREALPFYIHAAELSGGGGKALDGKPLDLSAPAFLVFHPPALSGRQRLPEGYVLAEFAVDRQGRARNVEIVEGIPPYFSETLGPRLVAAIRSARFRPRIVDGRPVATAGVRYRIELPTKEDRLPWFTAAAKQDSREEQARIGPG